MQDTPRPFPLPDRDTGPFWEAQNRHELRFQRCSACRAVRYPIGPTCPHCHSFQFEWVTSSGRGKIYSYTIVHYQAHPAFPVPYTVVLVEMEEGPRIIAQLKHTADVPWRIGTPVRVEWEDHPKQSLPVFVIDA